jgi:hypothetical protein
MRLLPESFWDWNGYGSWVFLSHFPISHASWLFPMVFELLCRSLLREQCQNLWFPVEWRAEMNWKCWSSLNMEDQLPLSRLRGWKLLFLSLLMEIRHDVGSSCNRYRAYPLTASVSDLVGPTDRLSTTVWVLGYSFFGLQLPLPISLITFRPNNYVTNIISGCELHVGFFWASK